MLWNATLKRTEQVPCGKCMPCRINKTQEWLIRLEYERMEHRDNTFLTLTYDDEHIPKDKSLDQKAMSLFMKRLRRHIDYPVKYYGVGEYGETEKKYWNADPKFVHGRPHYHVLLFGFDGDKNRDLLADMWPFCDRDLFLNPYFKAVGEVNGDSIRYVCDYLQKKQYGEKSVEEYGDADPPFSRSSQNLGLSAFLREDIASIKKNGYILYNGRKVPIPRYFREKIEFQYPSFVREDDIYRQYCLKHHLLTEDEVIRFDNFSRRKKYNPFYEFVRDCCPEHLEEIEKNLKIKNNLYRGKPTYENL